MKEISFIVPAMNEEDNLPYVIPKIPETAEVILVDGHSKDRTIEVARELRSDIVVLTQPGKGKGDAILAGVKAASRKYIVVFDGDGSHSIDEIPKYLEAAKNGAELVKGSRYLPGAKTYDETFLHKITIIIAQGLANFLWNTRYSDICYGMFLIEKEKYLELNLDATGFNIEWELMSRAAIQKLKVVEIPAIEYERVNGTSNISYWRDGKMIATTVFKEFFYRLKNKQAKRGKVI